MFFRAPAQEASLSRFEHRKELKPLLAILEALRERNTKLAVDAKKNGEESIDAKKHAIISQMLIHLDSPIQIFNNNSMQADADEEARQVLELVNRLIAIMAVTLNDHINTLIIPRDSKKLAANIAVHGALFGGAVIGVCALPVSWPFAIVAALTADAAIGKGRELTGLSNLMPASTQLILKFYNKLTHIHEKLSLELRHQITIFDHYETLGLEHTATATEIRKAYYQRAREHHPDKEGNADMFVKITAAYNVLSDPESKNEYDISRGYVNQENIIIMAPRQR